jgi:hypothetical protein
MHQLGRVLHLLGFKPACAAGVPNLRQLPKNRQCEPTDSLANPALVELLALTPVARDPLPDIRRAIPKPDPRVLATREELDCLRVHESNFSEIQKQPSPCRFLAQQALQLGHCLSVDPTAQEIKDPSS